MSTEAEGRSHSPETGDPMNGCSHPHPSDMVRCLTCGQVGPDDVPRLQVVAVLSRTEEPYQCQGCGAVRYGSQWRDRAHACWRNEDGTYEEGGTFQ